MSPSTSTLKQVYDERGYVVIPGLVSPEALVTLKEACARVVARTRDGKWPHRRTVGSQFPPYDAQNPDSWGVQHVMHPELGEPAFAQWYTGDGLVRACCELLACEEDELQMGASTSLAPLP